MIFMQCINHLRGKIKILIDSTKGDDFSMNSYTEYWKRYADFNGRSSRQDFWVPILINFAVSAGLMIAVACSLIDLAASSLFSSVTFCISAGLITAWKLVRLVPDAAVTVRRTHDVGLTGWVGAVIYICSLIPYLDFAAGVLLVVIGCMAADSANLSALAWQPDAQEAASAEKARDLAAKSSAANTASKSDAKHYEQLSLDLDDSDHQSGNADKSAK